MPSLPESSFKSVFCRRYQNEDRKGTLTWPLIWFFQCKKAKQKQTKRNCQNRPRVIKIGKITPKYTRLPKITPKRTKPQESPSNCHEQSRSVGPHFSASSVHFSAFDFRHSSPPFFAVSRFWGASLGLAMKLPKHVRDFRRNMLREVEDFWGSRWFCVFLGDLANFVFTWVILTI